MHRSGKNSGEGESSGSGAAFPACLVAHCDCSDNASDRSDVSSHTSSVPMLSLHNPFDVLGDMDFLPEEIVDELMYGADSLGFPPISAYSGVRRPGLCSILNVQSLRTRRCRQS